MKTGLFLFAVLLSLNVSLCYHNVTVDDTSSSITYTGIWQPLSEQSNSLDYGGAHHVSGQQGATATFSFTGVAFYYMAPLWPYNVTTVVSVDGNSITVDLQDHQSAQQPCCGAETKPSQILASFLGLSNGPHSVVCSMEPGNGFVVVDAFVYTVVDPADNTQTSSPLVSTIVVAATVTTAAISSSSTLGAVSTTTSPTTTTTTTTKPSNLTLFITIGVGVGVAGIIVVATLMCLRQKRRLLRSEESAPFIESYKAQSPRGGRGNMEMNSIARSSRTASVSSSSTTAAGGFFLKAKDTNASHSQFSDVQGDQSNTRIHTINYFIGETSKAVVEGRPI